MSSLSPVRSAAVPRRDRAAGAEAPLHLPRLSLGPCNEGAAQINRSAFQVGQAVLKAELEDLRWCVAAAVVHIAQEELAKDGNGVADIGVVQRAAGQRLSQALLAGLNVDELWPALTPILP